MSKNFKQARQPVINLKICPPLNMNIVKTRPDGQQGQALAHLTLAATSDSVFLCRHHTDYMRM